jgi:hypothetical protein
MDPTRFAHVHAHLRYLTAGGETFLLPEKAYRNPTWLQSHGAKTVRRGWTRRR